MSEDAPTIFHVILSDEVSSGQLTVSLESFAEFCVRMELELEVFENRFASFAAPRAILLRRQSL